MGVRAMSKLTSKYQTTIPAPVRETLGLAKGDSIVFEIQGPAHVVLRKAMRLDLDFAEALEPLLGEWDSEEDEEAYRGL
ncbi:MAG: type II toxin-antitoxin system PrlF family antitoxin [Thermoleophilia bacterium]|nr:type II toxin-antitoxin system PrlF family antitoxin [Thermoleophilia bacterium]